MKNNQKEQLNTATLKELFNFVAIINVYCFIFSDKEMCSKKDGMTAALPLV